MNDGDVRGGGRDVMASLSNRVMGMVMDELNREQTRSHIKHNVITPVVRIFMVELMPYAIVLLTILVVMLLLLITTLLLQVTVYLKVRDSLHVGF